MSFKIQIIEDDEVTSTLLSKRLTNVGFEVNTANDVDSGIYQIRQFKPDLILLDFYLPSGRGVDVLAQLRPSDQTPVMITTSGIDVSQKEKLQSLKISGYWEKPFNINSLISEIEKLMKESPSQVKGSQKRILVIDDDADILKIIKLGIASQKYDVLTSIDSRSALQAVCIHNPDLIILDLTMPGMTGWHFSQTLRQNPKYSQYQNIPIIILSALVDAEGPGATPMQGDYMMTKPFELNKVVAKMKELLP